MKTYKTKGQLQEQVWLLLVVSKSTAYVTDAKCWCKEYDVVERIASTRSLQLFLTHLFPTRTREPLITVDKMNIHLKWLLSFSALL